MSLLPTNKPGSLFAFTLRKVLTLSMTREVALNGNWKGQLADRKLQSRQ